MDDDDILLDMEERMQKAVDVFRGELRGMRTGRAHPGLVETIRVEYYGSPTPLKQIASISVPEADQIVIKPFDQSALGDIEKGILKSDLGISPNNDGKILRLKVPPLSEERRKQLVSRAKEVAEEARVAIRNVRRDANKSADSSQKDGTIGKDDLQRLKDEIQSMTKNMEGEVDKDLARKTSELMEI
jgi:ribosome recycling factor